MMDVAVPLSAAGASAASMVGIDLRDRDMWILQLPFRFCRLYRGGAVPDVLRRRIDV